MPVATDLAGVNMRLKANAYRELHWHTAAEWGYVFAGSARINAVDQNGKAYAADIYPGDIWVCKLFPLICKPFANEHALPPLLLLNPVFP